MLIDLAGLVVRWVDTPGIVSSSEHAAKFAREACSQADLVMSCTDFHGRGAIFVEHPLVVGVRLRCDRGGDGPGLAVSARDGAGMDALIAIIRERLVPSVAMEDPSPWAFWAE